MFNWCFRRRSKRKMENKYIGVNYVWSIFVNKDINLYILGVIVRLIVYFLVLIKEMVGIKER